MERDLIVIALIIFLAYQLEKTYYKRLPRALTFVSLKRHKTHIFANVDHTEFIMVKIDKEEKKVIKRSRPHKIEEFYDENKIMTASYWNYFNLVRNMYDEMTECDDYLFTE